MKVRKATIQLIVSSAILAFCAFPASAQIVIAPGAMTIDGYSVSCGGARTVITGPELGDVAKGGPTGIYLNGHAVSNFPTGVKIFIYTHECSHVLFGGDENLADRFAINRGRDQGWINEAVLNQICSSVYMSPGDWTHLPGPARCELMLAYYLYG